MLNVGVIGAGGMGSIHIDIWKSMNNINLSVCDIRLPIAEGKVREFNGAPYDSIDEMLNDGNLDILDICTPTYLHFDNAMAAIERKINVIIEKPIAMSSADARTIFDAARKNGVKVMVAQVIRFWSEYVTLREIIEKKTYGEILNGSFWRLSAKPQWSWENWMLDGEKSGLVPLDLHIHDLDYIVGVFGMPLNCEINQSFKDGDEMTSEYHAVYKYDKFFISTEAAWFNNQYPFSSGFRIHLEDAVVEFNEGRLKAYLKSGEDIILCGDVSNNIKNINLPSTNAYYNEINYFANRVLEDKPIDIVSEADVIDVLTLLGR